MAWREWLRREVQRETATLQKLVLVPYRPFRNLQLGLGGALLILLTAALSFYLGNHYGRSVAGASPQEVARLRETVRMYAEQSQKLRDQAAVAEHDRDIVQAATDQVRNENKNLLASIAALEDQVALYKRLTSPAAAAQPVSIDKFEVTPGLRRGTVDYRLMLTRTANTQNTTTALVQVKVSGSGHSVSLPLPESSYSFQYFQNISGNWTPPAGFNPEQVDVVVVSRGLRNARVEKRFRWELH